MSEVDEQVNDYDDSYTPVSYDDSSEDDDKYSTTLVEDNPTSTESTYSSDSSDSSYESHAQDTSDNYDGSSSGGSYVGSVNSNKFHYPSCGQAGKIKSGNLITFSSREDAISSGYSPCSFCNP